MKWFLVYSLLFFSVPSFAEEVVAVRSLRVVVDFAAPPEVKQAAERVLFSIAEVPLLSVLARDGAPPSSLTDSKAFSLAPIEERAFNHLIVIGLPGDPMVQAVWQREAAVEPGGFYIFGFGHLRGDVGYIESDRNPFLHGNKIKRAPFETEVITITGSTPTAIRLAVEAFLQKGLVNGVVCGPQWERPESTLLDRAPLSSTDVFPATPERLGEWSRLGITQASEDEYRGVLADTNVVPEEIWRVKYYKPGVWDGAGAEKAFDHYSAGLHKRAYGNTVWLARFSSEAEAQGAARKIAAVAKLQPDGIIWRGKQPPYGPQKESSGDLSLWQQGEWVIMCTLPAGIVEVLAEGLGIGK